MASLTDLVTDTRNAARPNSAKVSSSRAPGGATLVCDNLSGWPTASKVHFVTYQIDSSSNPVAGTQLDAIGIVSGNSITSFTVKDGADSGNAVNDVVEMLPTAAWGQDLATALTAEHDRTGKHTNITTSSITNSGNSTIGGNQTVAGTLGVTGATTLTGAVGGAGYDTKTLANSYKFQVYRNAAQNIGSNTSTKVSFDTKLYDTGSNFDAVTNFRFVAPVNGFYVFSVAVSCQAFSGDVLYLDLYKNGVVYIRPSQTITSSAVTHTLNHTTTPISLTATDYIEIFFGHTTAGTMGLNVGTAPIQTYFGGFLSSQT